MRDGLPRRFKARSNVDCSSRSQPAPELQWSRTSAPTARLRRRPAPLRRAPRRRAGDRPQRRGHTFAVLPTGVAQAVADQVLNACLDRRLRKRRLDRFSRRALAAPEIPANHLPAPNSTRMSAGEFLRSRVVGELQLEVGQQRRVVVGGYVGLGDLRVAAAEGIDAHRPGVVGQRPDRRRPGRRTGAGEARRPRSPRRRTRVLLIIGASSPSFIVRRFLRSRGGR